MIRKLFQLFSPADFIDAYLFIKSKSTKHFSILHLFSKTKRSQGKWNAFDYSKSDFWVIPEIEKWWNQKCSGHSNISYEEYISKKYFANSNQLKMLSVGCGNSDHEVAFSKSNCFESIHGIDISEVQLTLAQERAIKNNCHNIRFECIDFEKSSFLPESFDVILFHSSLHHFHNIESVLVNSTLPILKKGGMLVIFEYTGPNRLQWTKDQLKQINVLLASLPATKKTLYNSNIVKKRVFKPGLLRMWISDPTEAADSENMLNAVHRHFETIEEKKLGGNLVHPLLKNIAHHFLDDSVTTKNTIKYLIEQDDVFVKNHKSDFTFGVYKKPKA